MTEQYEYYKRIKEGQIVQICYFQVVKEEHYQQTSLCQGWCLNDYIGGFNPTNMEVVDIEEFRELVRQFRLGERFTISFSECKSTCF